MPVEVDKEDPFGLYVFLCVVSFSDSRKPPENGQQFFFFFFLVAFFSNIVLPNFINDQHKSRKWCNFDAGNS